MKAWLKLFRIVNLPTVPGDIWVGAVAFWSGVEGVAMSRVPFVWATLASCFIYLYGLVDNDIAGAETDKGRPIPDGQISMVAARIARGICWAVVLVLGVVPDPFAHARLPIEWWYVTLILFLAISIYNRTKAWWLMGLCRGLNVLAGGAVAYAVLKPHVAYHRFFSCCSIALAAVALVWTIYIAVVTRYSEGEELDAAKKQRVGFLVGAILYLQIVALILFRCPSSLLIAIAVLLVLKRFAVRLLPEVSAS